MQMFAFELTVSVESESFTFGLEVVFEFEEDWDEIDPDDEDDKEKPDDEGDEDGEAEDGVVPFELEAIVNAYIPSWQRPPPREMGYIETSPRPKIDNMSPTGIGSIEFTEPVYELDGDLSTKKIGLRKGLRNLDEVITAVPFIDVLVIPGENSDPDKLGFTFNAKFVDSTSLEVSIEWENPMLVSATQPEDVL